MSHLNERIERLERVGDRPTARALIKQLVPENALGYTQTSGRVADKGSLVDFATTQKIELKDKVILLRSGDFYETYGVDAVMMVAYSNLNPMGGKCRAGCPVKNVQAALDGLTKNGGLSVAVFEEFETVKISKSQRRKSRILNHVVSPGSSLYPYDLCLRSDDIEFPVNRPFVGIIGTAEGSICFFTLPRK